MRLLIQPAKFLDLVFELLFHYYHISSRSCRTALVVGIRIETASVSQEAIENTYLRMGPIRKPFVNYTSIFEHLLTLFKKIGTGEIFEIKFLLQTLPSNTCGLHCLHIAHYLMRLADHFIFIL